MAPSDRVLASLLHKNTENLDLPPSLRGALDLERQRTREGFFTAYQCLPDTSHSSALLLYVFNAEIVRVAHKVKVNLLPRLSRKYFDGPWGWIKTMVPLFTNDHVAEWRAVGISCSASLFSLTEATPFRKFEEGYKGSGAPKPDGIKLMEEVLLQYGVESRLSQEIAKYLHDSGMKLFRDVGGSMIQLFFREDLAEDFVYLAENGAHGDCCRVMTHHGPKVPQILRDGNLDHTQIRLIARPEVFFEPKLGQIFHYCTKEREFFEARMEFRSVVNSVLRGEQYYDKLRTGTRNSDERAILRPRRHQ